MTELPSIVLARHSAVRRYAFVLMVASLLSCTGDGIFGSGGGSRVKWKTSVGRWVYYSSPAISSDGDIYVGSGNAGDFNVSGTGLYAISPTGLVRWKFPTSAPVFSPAIADDGLIYFQDATSTLYALDSKGTLRWSKAFNQRSGVGQVSPAIATDGTVYAGADGLYAFSSTGTQLWRYTDNNGPDIHSSPSVAADGAIIVGVNSGSGARVWKVNPNGTLAWSTSLPRSDGTNADFIFSSPAIGQDGTIYIGSESGTGGSASSLTALNANGTIKWHYDVAGGRPIRSSPSIAVDGTIYVATKASSSQPAELLAINPNGTLRWSYTISSRHSTPDDSYSSPAVSSNGTVYFGAETGLVYALDPNGALLWTFDTKNGINWTSPAIGAGGTVYIGSNEGFLYALNANGESLADSPWPRFRGNNRNSGRH
jgi:FOG: WD40-like repeat